MTIELLKAADEVETAALDDAEELVIAEELVADAELETAAEELEINDDDDALAETDTGEELTMTADEVGIACLLP